MTRTKLQKVLDTTRFKRKGSLGVRLYREERERTNLLFVRLTVFGDATLQFYINHPTREV